MTLLAPIGLAAALLGIPILLIHMLRPRRPRSTVSSLLHWRELATPVSANQPWQKLRWSLLLLIQLAVVALLALALAQPAQVETTELADHTVFIIDASGSMAANDGSPDRINDARQRALQLHSQIPEGGAVSVVVASPRPSVLLDQSDDDKAFARAIATIRTTAGRADFETAFTLAEGLTAADRPTGFVLISDGGLTENEQRAAPRGVRFEPVGRDKVNRAITDLSVNAVPGGLQARVTVSSLGGAEATQTLRIDVDGLTVDRKGITVPRDGVVEESFELPAGRTVAAYLEGEDLLGYDNQRFAAAPVAGTIRIRVFGDDTFFVDQLIAAFADVEIATSLDQEVDLELYVGVPVPAVIDTPFIAIDTPGGLPGMPAVGRVDNPVPTLVRDDPILEDVDVSRLAIADAQLVDATRGKVLLAAPGAPLLIRGEVDEVPFFYLTFTLPRSNLPIDVSFPILGSRMVGELSGATATTASLVVGDPVPVGQAGATVVDSRGAQQNVGIGDRPPITDLSGFWTIAPTDGPEVTVAANPNISESDLTAAGELPELPRLIGSDDPAFEAATVARSLLSIVIAALLVLLAVEMYLSWRSIGVGRRQWYTGVVTRIVLVVLLLLAFANPEFRRHSQDLTTVFVVDVSDSLGSEGAAASQSWARAALADRGASLAGVVEVGSDSRIVVPVGEGVYEGDRRVNPTETNLARGLRLAQSMLTGETRERIVLVSDGHPTTGDLAAEVERLKTLGVVVDVHPVARDEVTDAAITAIDGPESVSVDESYEVAVEVTASVAGPAVVRLLADGGLVEEREVTMVAGSNQVAFTVEAAAGGIQRIEAQVEMLGDVIAENDGSFVAVAVAGPPRVLIVEGTANNGAALADALKAASLEVERISATDFPTFDQLNAFQAVTLIDIDARNFPEENVAGLDRFVRDLGRGLVVIAGNQSYALGGYRQSALEALLPVDSEVADLEREADVAEVLLIDTSESMGACHCAPVEGNDDPFAGEMLEGGANKTDISRAAAGRAIQTLSANDEIGVLAFNASQDWIIPLQQLPTEQVVTEGLGTLKPFGETRLQPALDEAAASLRESTKELRHIILFTDGFTPELFEGEEFGGGSGFATFADLVAQAEALAAEGITISVVATGEGAMPALQKIAEAGNGRFYPGRDLDEIPEIFVKEARLASRSFINEGDYYPTVVSVAPAVRNLASSPALLGFVAASPKPTAEVQLEIGEFADPLLASWRVGLGRVTSWMSDGGDRWAAQWATWEGFQDFWSAVVRDTFPLGGSSGERLSASVVDDRLEITLESADPWPVGTSPIARVGSPAGTSEEVRLERESDYIFTATVAARDAGTYAVGVGVASTDGTPITMAALASRTYSAEYIPAETDVDRLVNLSAATGGRGAVTAGAVFDPAGLEDGVRSSTYRTWFLLAAALLWPFDVAVRRIRLSWPGQQDR